MRVYTQLLRRHWSCGQRNTLVAMDAQGNDDLMHNVRLGWHAQTLQMKGAELLAETSRVHMREWSNSETDNLRQSFIVLRVSTASVKVDAGPGGQIPSTHKEPRVDH